MAFTDPNYTPDEDKSRDPDDDNSHATIEHPGNPANAAALRFVAEVLAASSRFFAAIAGEMKTETTPDTAASSNETHKARRSTTDPKIKTNDNASSHDKHKVKSSGRSSTTEPDFSKLLVDDLQDMLAQRNLPVTGVKEDLVRKLQHYERGTTEPTRFDLTEYDALRVKDLRKMLRMRGGEFVTGVKADLIRRLALSVARQLDSLSTADLQEIGERRGLSSRALSRQRLIDRLVETYPREYVVM
jgi:SAP domain